VKAVALKDVCRITNGGTPKSGVESLWHGGVAWLTPAEMGKRGTPYIAKTARTISKDGLANSSAKLVPPNSVILSTRAPIGHLAINEIPMAFNQGCRGLTPSDKLDAKYLYYFLYFSREALDELGTGTTFKELSSSNLASFHIPLPPLHEQRRIVAVLDKAFAGIATATTNAQKNLTNARALFESYASDAFEELTLASVKRPSLETLTEAKSGITYGVVKPGDMGAIPFVRGGDLIGGEVRMDRLRTITNEVSAQYSRTLLCGGELLMCLVGVPGQCAIAPAELAGANIARQVGLIRLRPDVNAEYVKDYLQSPPGQKSLGTYTSGSVQQVINLGDLRQVAIPLPERQKQDEMVERISNSKRLSGKLAKAFEGKLVALTELKQSHPAAAGW
jgi:type I restriction enzyme, S subunit